MREKIMMTAFVVIAVVASLTEVRVIEIVHQSNMDPAFELVIIILCTIGIVVLALLSAAVVPNVFGSGKE